MIARTKASPASCSEVGSRDGVRARVSGASAAGARSGGNDVVERAEGQLRAAHPQAALRHLGLAAMARELVDHVPVDEEELHAVAELLDHVQVPDLVEERPAGHLRSTCFFSSET